MLLQIPLDLLGLLVVISSIRHYLAVAELDLIVRADACALYPEADSSPQSTHEHVVRHELIIGALRHVLPRLVIVHVACSRYEKG